MVDSTDEQKTTGYLRLVLILIGITGVIIIVPISLQAYSNQLQKVNLDDLWTQFDQNVAQARMASNALREGLALSIELMLVILSSAFLFRIGGIKEDTLRKLGRFRLWRNTLGHVFTPSN